MTKSMDNLLDEYSLFHELPDKTRWEKVCELLNFNIAGERCNKQLLFFLLLGNYHKSYKTFVLYRGDSSAGKNYVVQNVLQLFPTKDIYILDSATAAALNYDSALKGKVILYLRELEPKDGIVDLLKGIYNPDNRIHKETIRDEETNKLMVETHILERMGVVTTFSFENIKIDLINRGWVLVPDQSYKQTKDIIDFDINARKNMIERDLQKKEMLKRCFFISQCIKALDFNYKVYIPYINKLEVLLPDTQLNVRRDKDKLFDLISIITLWNQKNRQFVEIDGIRYLISEYTDLKMALEISQNLFINLVLHLDDTKRAILDFMEEFELIDVVDELNLAPMLDNFGGNKDYSRPTTVKEQEVKYSITQIYEEIRSLLSVSRKTIQRKLNDLFFEGYLLREKEGAKYVFSKLHDYDLIKMLKLEEIHEEIDSIVEQTYIYYSNKDKELLEVD